MLGYVVAAIAMTWRLWFHLTSMAPTNGYGVSPDVYLNAWFMRYAATAVAHGRFGTDHHRGQLSARHQRDVEHLVLAAFDLARPGDPARRTTRQPHRCADAGLRGVCDQHVRGAAPLGSEHRSCRGGWCTLCIFPGHAGGRGRSLSPAVRNPAAADRRCGTAACDRPGTPGANWDLAWHARGRAGLHRRR